LNLNLWNSRLLDRIISDYIVSTEIKVESVDKSKSVLAPPSNKKERCKYYDEMPIKALPNCGSYKMEKSKLS